MENTTREIWRPVKGYEGHYEVSNLGNVKSHDKTVYYKIFGHTVSQFFAGHILKQSHNNKGYMNVVLNKDGNKKTFKVHRLVAEAFIGDIYNKEIDHINTIRDDNRVENLRIVNSSENNNNPITKERKAARRRKRVRCITQDGTVIEFDSIVKAAKSGYGYREDSISLCCNGKYLTHNNNRWEFI